MKNLRRLSAVFLIGGFGLVAACSDNDEDNGNGGSGGSDATGGSDSSGGSDASGGSGTGGNDGTGGENATGGMGGNLGGGAGEGGMGGMTSGTGGDAPMDDKMCVASCTADSDCGGVLAPAFCVAGECAECTADIQCEHSKTTCTSDSDCAGNIVEKTCIKDGDGGGICAEEDGGFGCFGATAAAAKKYSDDSDVTVCEKDSSCEAGECVSACSLDADCQFGPPGRTVCNTDSGQCDACSSGTCDECSSDADCMGKGGTCSDGVCTCTDASTCTALPHGGTAVCE